MSSCTALSHLREALWLEALPDVIEVPASPNQVITKPVYDATVDDIALAVDALARRATTLFRTADALRQIHDLARSASALGTANAASAAARALALGSKRPQESETANGRSKNLAW